MKSLIFINSHPIQYFAPLYAEIAQIGKLNTKVWYCSDETIKGSIDAEFTVAVKWDIPILNGYNYTFFRNQSFKPSIFNGFFGLINLGLLRALFREPPSVIVVHGWGFCTHFLAILLGKIAGHTICLRAETPLVHELEISPIYRRIKHLLLKLLFTRVHFFLSIGKENKAFYQYLNIHEKRIYNTPYCVNNVFFSEAYSKLNKDLVKDILGLSHTSKYILFVGKYVQKKRPMDLLISFHNASLNNTKLIFVGEGEQRNILESYIKKNNLEDQVILTGFVNQTEIVQYYSIADLYVMCSDIGETWGLAVNEAMNFNLPIIVSDKTGCAYDLVIPYKNGIITKTGDIGSLKQALVEILDNQLLKEEVLIATNQRLLDTHSYQSIIQTIKKIASL